VAVDGALVEAEGLWGDWAPTGFGGMWRLSTPTFLTPLLENGLQSSDYPAWRPTPKVSRTNINADTVAR